jgi:RHS repeat-associated protein
MSWAERRTTDGGTLQTRVEVQYDAYGNRVEKKVDANGDGTFETTQRYALDGWRPGSGFVGTENWDVWADLDASSSLTTRYMRADVIDGVFARLATDPAWLLPDRLGSIREVLDKDGVLKDVLAYDGFGNITSETDATWGGRYKYTGREYDAEVELQYHRRRYYDPKTGRWTSQDPKGFDAGDSNLYRYAMNQFTSRTDPSGLQDAVRPDRAPTVSDLLKGPNGMFSPDQWKSIQLKQLPKNNSLTASAPSVTAKPSTYDLMVQYAFSDEVPKGVHPVILETLEKIGKAQLRQMILHWAAQDAFEAEQKQLAQEARQYARLLEEDWKQRDRLKGKLLGLDPAEERRRLLEEQERLRCQRPTPGLMANPYDLPEPTVGEQLLGLAKGLGQFGLDVLKGFGKALLHTLKDPLVVITGPVELTYNLLTDFEGTVGAIARHIKDSPGEAAGEFLFGALLAKKLPAIRRRLGRELEDLLARANARSWREHVRALWRDDGGAIDVDRLLRGPHNAPIQVGPNYPPGSVHTVEVGAHVPARPTAPQAVRNVTNPLVARILSRLDQYPRIVDPRTGRHITTARKIFTKLKLRHTAL